MFAFAEFFFGGYIYRELFVPINSFSHEAMQICRKAVKLLPLQGDGVGFHKACFVPTESNPPMSGTVEWQGLGYGFRSISEISAI